MSDVSILKIEVDDSEFQRFKAEFAKFQGDAAEMPEAWAATDEQIAKVRKNYEAMLKAAGAQNAAADKTSESTKKTGASAVEWAKSWSVIYRGSRGLAAGIAQSTLQLARWRGLTATFSGLIGAGGLFGLNNMAASAARRRSEALGIGSSYGERAAFAVNFGRIGNTDAILSGINAAATDVNRRQPLFSMGVDPTGKNPTQVFTELLPLVKKLVDRTDPSQLGNVIRSYGLDQLGIDTTTAMTIRGLRSSEINDLVRSNRADAKAFDVPDDIARRWTEFMTTIGKAETQIGATLARNLVNVTPGLTHLSENVVKLFDEVTKDPRLAAGLKKVGDTLTEWAEMIGADSVQDRIKRYVKKFDATKRDFDQVNKWFSAHADLFKYLAYAGVGYQAWRAGVAVGTAARVIVGAAGSPVTVAAGFAGVAAKYRFGTYNPRNFADTPENRQKTQNLSDVPDMGGTDDDPQGTRDKFAPKSVAPGDHPASLPTTNLFGRPVDTADVNPRLLEVTAAAEKYLPEGYHAKIKEGYNAAGHVPGSMHHKKGEGALDIQIYGPDGKAIYDEGNDPTGVYHRYARAVYGETLRRYPEMAKKYAWGGQFGASRTNSSQDLMHHDFGGARGQYIENNPARMGPLPEQMKSADPSRPSGRRGMTSRMAPPRPTVEVHDNTGGASHVEVAPAAPAAPALTPAQMAYRAQLEKQFPLIKNGPAPR